MNEQDYKPRARTRDLLVEGIGDDLIVCDVPGDAAHLLINAAAAVWRACDGVRDIPTLQSDTGFDRDTIESALEQLRDRRLLEEAETSLPPTARTLTRSRMLPVGLAPAVALPAIESITVPRPATAIRPSATTTTAAPITTTGAPPITTAATPTAMTTGPPTRVT